MDLGCGYGPIAVALALRCPGATVWATDTNERAIDLCRHNAATAGVTGQVKACLVQSEPEAPGGARDSSATGTGGASEPGLPPSIKFDAVYSNPPIRIGKPRLHALLLDTLDRLGADGNAYLVVHKHLGSDSLQRWLTGQGWPTERLGSRAGYRILHVAREPAENS